MCLDSIGRGSGQRAAGSGQRAAGSGGEGGGVRNQILYSTIYSTCQNVELKQNGAGVNFENGNGEMQSDW